jgi:hypothetical protein
MSVPIRAAGSACSRMQRLRAASVGWAASCGSASLGKTITSGLSRWRWKGRRQPHQL